MITLRKAHERGHTTYGGWLQSAHTFSFGDYFDLNHQGHGNLRVINDDRVAPGQGFGRHGHRDMEIVSYVLDGELAHQDSIGHGGVLRAGDVQRMSAGTGVTHSEFNHSSTSPVHFLQIWILPKFKGIRPSYEQKHFAIDARRGRLALIVSPDGEGDSLRINADARMEAGVFDGDEHVTRTLSRDRLTYVHLARGELDVNGQRLAAGDGALLEEEPELRLSDGREAEVLVFDLAPTN